MHKVRLGINGFGRIGRVFTRLALERKTIEVVAINSRADAASHAYLLKYDSVYGVLPQTISSSESAIVIGGRKVHVFQYSEPREIPWNDIGIDIVIEATGKFRKRSEALGHLKGGAKRVIIAAPPKDDMPTICLGVNEETLKKSDTIISNASCTTNCLSVVCKVLDQEFTIEQGFMTTTHAYTDSQNLLDNSHKKDARLARAAALSIIPTSTGASSALGKVLPRLKGKIISSALRVPVPTVSLIDLSVITRRSIDIDDVNAAFFEHSKKNLKGILTVTSDPVVSSDLKGNTHSAVVDAALTAVHEGNFVNVKAWYDNEVGYSARLLDLAQILGSYV